MGMLDTLKGALSSSNEPDEVEASTVIVQTLNKNDTDARKQSAITIVTLWGSGNFSDAEENAQKFASGFGDEFLYFYLPVSSLLRKIANSTADEVVFESRGDEHIGADFYAQVCRTPAEISIPSTHISDLVRAINSLKQRQKKSLKERRKLFEKTKTTGKPLEQLNRVEPYLNAGCSAIFASRCVAESFAAYSDFEDFVTGVGLKSTDYAIPGPEKSSPSSKFNFMKSIAHKTDAENLFAVYSLICSYQSEKKNMVSVGAGACSAMINLNNGFLFIAKNCKLIFKFSGENKRLFQIKGKINLKKYPELLEKAKSFNLWKPVEGKPTIAVNFALKDEEFKSNVGKISETAKVINAENDEIKAVLTAK